MEEEFQGGVGNVPVNNPEQIIGAPPGNENGGGNVDELIGNADEIELQLEFDPEPDFDRFLEGWENIEDAFLELQEMLDTPIANENVENRVVSSEEGNVVVMVEGLHPTTNNKVHDHVGLPDELLEDEEDLGDFPPPSVVFSPDPKPRLQWTPELHACFVRAVRRLGGSIKATPRSIQYVMAVQGLGLFHVKSHLQKYRQGRQVKKWCGNTKNDKDTGISEVPGNASTFSLPPVSKKHYTHRKSKGKAKADEENQGSIYTQMLNVHKMLCNQAFGGTNIASGSYIGQNPPSTGIGATIAGRSYFGQNLSAGIGATTASGRYFWPNPTGIGNSATIPSGSYFGQNYPSEGSSATMASGIYFGQNPINEGISATTANRSYFGPNPTSIGMNATIPSASSFGQNPNGAGISSIVSNGSYFGQNPASVGITATIPSSSYFGQNLSNVGINATIASGSYFEQNPTSIGTNATIVSGNYFGQNPSSVGINAAIASGSYPSSVGINAAIASGSYPSSVGINTTIASGSYPSNVGITEPMPTFVAQNQLNTYNAYNSMEAIRAHTSVQQQHHGSEVPLTDRPQGHFSSVMHSASSFHQHFNAPGRASKRLQISDNDPLNAFLNFDNSLPAIQEDNNYSSFNYSGGAGTSN